MNFIEQKASYPAHEVKIQPKLQLNETDFIRGSLSNKYEKNLLFNYIFNKLHKFNLFITSSNISNCLVNNLQIDEKRAFQYDIDKLASLYAGFSYDYIKIKTKISIFGYGSSYKKIGICINKYNEQSNVGMQCLGISRLWIFAVIKYKLFDIFTSVNFNYMKKNQYNFGLNMFIWKILNYFINLSSLLLLVLSHWLNLSILILINELFKFIFSISLEIAKKIKIDLRNIFAKDFSIGFSLKI